MLYFFHLAMFYYLLLHYLMMHYFHAALVVVALFFLHYVYCTILLLQCINVALVHIALLILHYLNVALFTVVLYLTFNVDDVALLILEYFQCCSISRCTILMFIFWIYTVYFPIYCPLFNVALCSFSTVLFCTINVALFEYCTIYCSTI